MGLSPKKGKEVEAPPREKAKTEESRADATAFDLEKKIEAIKASAMPEKQKDAYIAELSGSKSDPTAVDRVPFTVWANSRNIRASVRVGMLAFPKAKGVASATFQEWDEIFKDF